MGQTHMSIPQDIKWTPEQVARFWDYQSHRPSAAANYFSISHGMPVAKRTLSRVAKNKAASILDFGCGTGNFLKFISQLRPDIRLHGADFSSESIRVAQETCSSIEPPPDLRTLSSVPTPWASESFDAIFSLEVVEHLADPELEAMINEIHRLLKKGGHVVITTPNDENLEQLHTCCPNCGSTFHIWQHVRSWSRDSLTEFMSRHGFTLVSAKSTELRPPRMRFLLWVARAVGIIKSKPPRILAVFCKRTNTSSDFPQ